MHARKRALLPLRVRSMMRLPIDAIDRMMMAKRIVSKQVDLSLAKKRLPCTRIPSSIPCHHRISS